jgi:UDP-N-acetylmuramoylalanine-D-glutamate ligase
MKSCCAANISVERSGSLCDSLRSRITHLSHACWDQRFSGVEHRLEFVRNWQGTQWYNSSIATAPERTMADLSSFTEPMILLLGGRDKNLPWEDLARLIHNKVDHVIVFGEAAFKILASIGLLSPGEKLTSIACASDFENALYQAAQISEPGDVILLAPGCTAYDAFKDFEEREIILRNGSITYHERYKSTHQTQYCWPLLPRQF